MVTKRVVFSTFVSEESDKFCTSVLIDSLRANGGILHQSPFWIFSNNYETQLASDKNVDFFQLPESNLENHYFFSEKVRSWALAESYAKEDFDTLIWVDPACIVFNPPISFLLEDETLAAFRPVHIRNVGQLFGLEMDQFWTLIYAKCNTPKPSFSVKSFVDGQEIYPYFNTHCFSIMPRKGMLEKTLENLNVLDNDQEFISTCCSDNLHKVFLFQAVLVATVLNEISETQIRLLPPDYSYPLHLANKIADEDKIQDLEKLTVMVYEEKKIAEEVLSRLDMPLSKRQWLKKYFQIQ